MQFFVSIVHFLNSDQKCKRVLIMTIQEEF